MADRSRPEAADLTTERKSAAAAPKRREPLALLLAAAAAVVVSGIAPYDWTTWLLEAFPVLIGAPLLVAPAAANHPAGRRMAGAIDPRLIARHRCGTGLRPVFTGETGATVH